MPWKLFRLGMTGLVASVESENPDLQAKDNQSIQLQLVVSF
jgi:hypothetical protein